MKALDKARADPRLARDLVSAQVDLVNACIALHGIDPVEVVNGCLTWVQRFPDLKSEERYLMRRKQRLGMLRVEVGEGDSINVTRQTFPPDEKEATPW